MIACEGGNNPPVFLKVVIDIEFELGTDVAKAEKALEDMVKA